MLLDSTAFADKSGNSAQPVRGSLTLAALTHLEINHETW